MPVWDRSMTAAVDESDPVARADRVLDRYGVEPVHLAVGLVVVAALLARFHALGARTAHWDEGRVAYWILQYSETGQFRYRPIIHGPFFQHVNRLVFARFGTSDFTMRATVALVTGLFPAVALLFRDRLRDVEVVALASFLAATPVVLYYSRFMRGDPLVAAFMVTAFALFVRTIDTGRRHYFYAGVAFTALGVTVKENALIYLLTWVGATALLLDHRLFRAADRGADWVAIATVYVRRVGSVACRHVGTLALGFAEFLLVVVAFYAPRGETSAGPPLGTVVADPTHGSAVVHAAIIGSARALVDTWVGGPHQDHAYLPYLADFLVTLREGALAVCLLALVGFVADRYSERGPSDLVSFAFYWGFVSVLGYPLATDIKAPWATIHAVVPLAIPAAVGVGLFVRWGRDAFADDDHVSTGLAALVVVLITGQLVASGAGAVYAAPHAGENELIQYAQPADGVQSVMQTLDERAPAHEGIDVLLYGEYFVSAREGSGVREPACATWKHVLPFPWYFQRADADVACAVTPAQLTDVVTTHQPPVVIARPIDEARFGNTFSAYESKPLPVRAWDTNTTFYVREAAGTDSRQS